MVQVRPDFGVSALLDKLTVLLSSIRKFEISSVSSKYSLQHDGVVGPNERGRSLVKLLNVKLVGSTDQTWKKFANAGQNPVRYISRPRA